MVNTQSKEEQHITAPLFFQQLTLKEANWTVKFTVGQRLEKLFSEYDVKFSLNEGPYERRIEQAKRERDEVKNNKHLFEDNYKEELKESEDKIKDIEQELVDARAQYEDIEFPAVMEKSEYKGNRTVLTMRISADDIQQIDAHKEDLMSVIGEEIFIYKVELIHKAKKEEE